MGFIEYYNVLPDVYIAFGMSRATVMAKAGPRYLRQAAVLEDELNRADGLNRATWTLLCDTGNTTDGHDTSEWLPISSTPNTDLTREDGTLEQEVRLLTTSTDGHIATGCPHQGGEYPPSEVSADRTSPSR